MKMNSRSPESYIAKAVKDRGVSLMWVARQTGIKYSMLQPSLTGRRELRADEYLACCELLGLEPREYASA